MAKKRATKRKAKAKTSRRSKREWKDVTFERLDAWRAARKIPKKTMAEMLGVTNSTYHNWARGIAVATPNTQSRILKVMSEADAGPAVATQEGPTGQPEVMAATGEIVALDHLSQLFRDPSAVFPLPAHRCQGARGGGPGATVA